MRGRWIAGHTVREEAEPGSGEISAEAQGFRGWWNGDKVLRQSCTFWAIGV